MHLSVESYSLVFNAPVCVEYALVPWTGKIDCLPLLNVAIFPTLGADAM